MNKYRYIATYKLDTQIDRQIYRQKYIRRQIHTYGDVHTKMKDTYKEQTAI